MSVNEWQPIETVPKDGTAIHLCGKRWDPDTDQFLYKAWYKCHFSSTNIRVNGWYNGPYIEEGYRLTHWMPIDDLPVKP